MRRCSKRSRCIVEGGDVYWSKVELEVLRKITQIETKVGVRKYCLAKLGETIQCMVNDPKVAEKMTRRKYCLFCEVRRSFHAAMKDEVGMTEREVVHFLRRWGLRCRRHHLAS